MIIYPYIALRGGRCVNLRRGRIDEPVEYDADPGETARAFAQAGAAWPHVVDLDAVACDGGHAGILRESIRPAHAPVMDVGRRRRAVPAV